MNDQQILLKEPDAVFDEIIIFYKYPLGSRASWFPAVDFVTMRRGKQLCLSAQQFLI